MAKKYRINYFRIFYLLLLAVLIIGMIYVKNYVKDVMYEYEDNVEENYLGRLVRNAENGELGKYLDENVFSTEYADVQQLRSAFYDKVKKAELTFKQTSDSYNSDHPVYYVSADGKPFLILQLTEGERYNRLGILTLTRRELSYAFLRDENSENEAYRLDEDGTVSVTFRIPQGYSLVMNGKDIDYSDGTESGIEDFKYLEDHTDVPVLFTKTVSGLRFEPVFSISNNGGEELEISRASDGSCTVPVEFVATAEAETLALSVADPIHIATVWSKFMTNDVGGSRHGLNTVKSECKLLEGSYFCDNAEKWASSVDITFVSHHSITGWTGEKASNFIKYSEKFFSVDVYLEKNMHLSTGADRTDVFNNRMYFVYIDDGSVPEDWYMVDMMALEIQ